LAANLRRLRIARRLSLSELARATGMSKATLSSVESGRSNPTVETLAGLAAALRVSLGELLEEPPLGEVRVIRGGRLDRVAEAGVELSARAWDPHQLEKGAPAPAGTRAGVYVLEGKLIAGPVERVTELGTGDYASFPVDVPYVYETERTRARALVLTYAA
jgi:transcriptional regulator with XRE-family HTH domain